jgi:adenylate cyclase
MRDSADDGSSRSPATAAEVDALTRRLRTEIGVINLAGIAVLAVSAVFVDPPGRPGVGPVTSLATLAGVAPLYLVGVVKTHRLARPVLDWLAAGTAGADAPPEVRRRLLTLPALQAVLLLLLWSAAAVTLATGQALFTTADTLRDFVSVIVGVGVAGLVVATLSFLTVQRVLGPWYPRFFVSTVPTAEHIRSTRVRRRLLVAFLLGGAVPMVMIGAAVGQRLDAPGGADRLSEIVWFLVAVGIGAGALLTLSVRQSIVRPLGLIRGAADAVRSGDLGVSVPVESADELGEVAVAFNAMVEGLRERRRVEDLFGRQVGPAVVERLLAEGVSLGGERRQASILILDLAGFSTLVEETDPESVVERLNAVFDVVVAEVDGRGGLVNKFLGDGVLAVFGVPVPDPEHARHAVEAATAIGAGLDPLGIDYGIGVSTGTVVAGNVGAEDRFEYTVVGDTVNEAARLEELTRERPARILVAGNTVVARGDADGLVALGTEHLRGRTHPTEVFGLR